MSQATADQPDQSANSAAAASPSADDLLSQLAGDEIDRLLSEAEVERPDGAGEAVDEFGGSSAGHAGETAAAIDSPSVSAAPIAHEEAPQTTAKEDVSAQLDDLFGQLKDGKTETAGEPKAESSASAAAEAAATTGSFSAPAADSAAATASAAMAMEADAVTPAESKALAESGVVAASTLTDEHGESEITTIDEEGPIDMVNVPIMLKPLVWLNFPLLACSATVRRNVGKVAIVTMLNAIAVLAYVIVTKKH